MNTLPIKKELILWARQRAGLDLDDVVKTFPKFLEWEQGVSTPTLNQLETLAKKLLTPLGFFFLTKPPEEQLPIPDFRSIADEPVEHPSPDLLETIYLMQRRQAWYREIIIEEGAQPLSFVGSATIKNKPEQVASSIRAALGITSGWANQESGWQAAFKSFWLKVENAGIMAVCNGVVGNNTNRILDVKEFRGFVLTDPYAPLVFINNADAKAAQIFTLAHELAHVWIGSAGVVNIKEMKAVDNSTEIFCNKVAAEVLIPAAEFESAWRLDPSFYNIAERFKVSPLVVARRALDGGYIDRDNFFGFYNTTMANVRTEKANKKGGNFYANCDFRIGHPFASAVARSVKSGKMLYHEAYNLTGLQGPTFDKYILKIKREGG